MRIKKELKQIEQTENNMGTAKISGLVLKTGVPLMVSLMINSLYNFVDSVFVSRVSEDALTALSLAAPIQILMSAMGLGIAVGLNAVILAIYVNSVLMVITPTAVAVYGACVKIQGLVTVGVNGMGSGLIPIVAYNYGAKKPDRIYQSCRWAMLYSVAFYGIFFLIMEIVPEQVLILFDASEEMLAIGTTALRIMAVSYLLSNVCLTYSSAFQGLGMGVQSMLLTLSRQVVLPVLFIAALSRLGNLSLIWMSFVLAEAVVIPFGLVLWRRESAKVLNPLEQIEKIIVEGGNKNSSKTEIQKRLAG